MLYIIVVIANCGHCGNNCGNCCGIIVHVSSAVIVVYTVFKSRRWQRVARQWQDLGWVPVGVTTTMTAGRISTYPTCTVRLASGSRRRSTEWILAFAVPLTGTDCFAIWATESSTFALESSRAICTLCRRVGPGEASSWTSTMMVISTCT